MDFALFLGIVCGLAISLIYTGLHLLLFRFYRLPGVSEKEQTHWINFVFNPPIVFLALILLGLTEWSFEVMQLSFSAVVPTLLACFCLYVGAFATLTLTRRDTDAGASPGQPSAPDTAFE